MHLINVSLASPSSEDSGERVSFSVDTSLTRMQAETWHCGDWPGALLAMST